MMVIAFSWRKTSRTQKHCILRGISFIGTVTSMKTKHHDPASGDDIPIFSQPLNKQPKTPAHAVPRQPNRSSKRQKKQTNMVSSIISSYTTQHHSERPPTPLPTPRSRRCPLRRHHPKPPVQVPRDTIVLVKPVIVILFWHRRNDWPGGGDECVPCGLVVDAHAVVPLLFLGWGCGYGGC